MYANGGDEMEKPIEKALDECLFFSVKKLDRLLNKLADEAFRKQVWHQLMDLFY
jgi:hypothetical protein